MTSSKEAVHPIQHDDLTDDVTQGKDTPNHVIVATSYLKSPNGGFWVNTMFFWVRAFCKL